MAVPFGYSCEIPDRRFPCVRTCSVFAGGSALERRGFRVTETTSSVVALVCYSALDLEGIHPLTSFFFPSDEIHFFGHLSYSFLSSKLQLYSHTLLLYAYSELQCGFSDFSQGCNVRKGSLCTICFFFGKETGGVKAPTAD